MRPTDLTALVGSRICHDLISPLGAIGNGVELLTMAGLNAAPEIALIAESVENANARIRFFRVAFGAAPPDTRVATTEIRAMLRDLTKGSRLKIDWQDAGNPSRADVKMAFLLILCLESAMAWGGSVRVAQSTSGWKITAHAERMNAVPVLWSQLIGDADLSALSPATVHFGLAAQEARDRTRPLTVDVMDTRIAVSF